MLTIASVAVFFFFIIEEGIMASGVLVAILKVVVVGVVVGLVVS